MIINPHITPFDKRTGSPEERLIQRTLFRNLAVYYIARKEMAKAGIGVLNFSEPAKKREHICQIYHFIADIIQEYEENSADEHQAGQRTVHKELKAAYKLISKFRDDFWGIPANATGLIIRAKRDHPYEGDPFEDLDRSLAYLQAVTRELTSVPDRGGRPSSPALDKLILRVGDLYENWTGNRIAMSFDMVKGARRPDGTMEVTFRSLEMNAIFAICNAIDENVLISNIPSAFKKVSKKRTVHKPPA